MEETILQLAFLMLALLALYFISRSKNGVDAEKKSARSNGNDEKPVKLIGLGSFQFEIVGESHYQKNIKKALGLRGGKSSKSFEAILIPEDYNKYDDKAVGVYVNQKKVGHLSKKEARKYRKQMISLGYEERSAVCNATVWGGGNKKYYGIWLDYNPSETKKYYSN